MQIISIINMDSWLPFGCLSLSIFLSNLLLTLCALCEHMSDFHPNGSTSLVVVQQPSHLRISPFTKRMFWLNIPLYASLACFTMDMYFFYYIFGVSTEQVQKAVSHILNQALALWHILYGDKSLRGYLLVPPCTWSQFVMSLIQIPHDGSV